MSKGGSITFTLTRAGQRVGDPITLTDAEFDGLVSASSRRKKRGARPLTKAQADAENLFRDVARRGMHGS